MKKILIISSLVLVAALIFALTPPFGYPEGSTVDIPEGASVKQSADILREAGALSSDLPFEIIVRLMSGNGVRAGTYALQTPEDALTLAYRFTNGVYGIDAVKVTIPEGYSNREIAERLAESLPGFNTKRFLEIALKDEGYLFPETYFFMPDVSPEAVERTMRSTFIEKTASLEAELLASGKTLHEIVTMASILEEEARQPETQKIVAGILWKRIDIGMALQVDAVFGFIKGVSGYAPTGDDLAIDSPYNTYTNRGLPPGPISNPGLTAIDAALHPTESPYLYYLTGEDGTMHYAETFEKHVANKKHLR